MKSLQMFLKITEHPPIHQTDGEGKDAAGGLKLSMIRETNTQYCSRMRSMSSQTLTVIESV